MAFDKFNIELELIAKRNIVKIRKACGYLSVCLMSMVLSDGVDQYKNFNTLFWIIASLGLSMLLCELSLRYFKITTFIRIVECCLSVVGIISTLYYLQYIN